MGETEETGVRSLLFYSNHNQLTVPDQELPALLCHKDIVKYFMRILRVKSSQLLECFVETACSRRKDGSNSYFILDTLQSRETLYDSKHTSTTTTTKERGTF